MIIELLKYKLIRILYVLLGTFKVFWRRFIKLLIHSIYFCVSRKRFDKIHGMALCKIDSNSNNLDIKKKKKSFFHVIRI